MIHRKMKSPRDCRYANAEISGSDYRYSFWSNVRSQLISEPRLIPVRFVEEIVN